MQEVEVSLSAEEQLAVDRGHQDVFLGPIMAKARN